MVLFANSKREFFLIGTLVGVVLAVVASVVGTALGNYSPLKSLLEI